jgi:hypothetical protein
VFEPQQSQLLELLVRKGHILSVFANRRRRKFRRSPGGFA